MSRILIFQNDNDYIKTDIKLEENAIWLSRTQSYELFGGAKSTISEYIRNIFNESELKQTSTIWKLRIVEVERIMEVSRKVGYYNLNVIIPVCFRVKSAQVTKFRIWARKKLSEFNSAVDMSRCIKNKTYLTQE